MDNRDDDPAPGAPEAPDGGRRSGDLGAASAGPRGAPLHVIVTGMSGAGRTTAINALEDIGFEALNNFPLVLIERLIDPGSSIDGGGSDGRPVAIGIETRTRGFSTRALIEALDTMRRRWRQGAVLLFLEASDEALLKRFSATRRRHPLAPGEDVGTGIARERDILVEVRGRADLLIDTSEMSPHDLKAEVMRTFELGFAPGLAVSIQSFSYKRGAPYEADMVLDCRFLRNPYWEPEIRPLTGRDQAVRDYVAADPLFDAFFTKLCEMVSLLLPAYKSEGKAHFAVALGCTGGRHRSVTVAEMLSRHVAAEGWQVTVRHRELERTAVGTSGAGHASAHPEGAARDAASEKVLEDKS